MCNPFVVRGPGVLVEAAAEEQLRRVAGLDGCVAAVGLPDLHPGPGIPIGAAFAFEGVVRPDLVGGDAGCGARVTVLTRSRASGDDLVRRLRAELAEGPLPDAAPSALAAAMARRGPRGLADVGGVPESLASLAEREADEDDAGGALDGAALRSLGTIGGGNHFAEVSRVGTPFDVAGARALGLARDAVVVVVHTGSRGLGRDLARRWAGRALAGAGPERTAYLSELAVAVRFARANRLVLTWRLLRALGATRESSIAASFDVVHNTVTEETVGDRTLFVHRKGAAPAAAGQPTIVLGTRGTPSFVLSGLGHPGLLASVAHGAGRRLVRSEAVARLRPRHTRASLERTRLGGRVLCDDTALMYEEHPDGYKPVEPVVDALVAAGAAVRVASLLPVVTAKL